MRADADFMVYVAARWPSLVKDAVLLGVPPEEAAAATIDALSRCRRDWGRASRDENVDALVQAELLLAARRQPRTSEEGREQQARELMVLAPPTLAELSHQESLNNRAILRRAALVAIPLLLVAVGVGVYLSTSGNDEPPATHREVVENVPSTLEENPAPGIVWYAGGLLHLDHTVLVIEGLREMTRIGTGVVYGDDEGRVIYAADDGSRELLGHKDPEAAVVATDENGWAAWVATDTEHPTIVVKEASTGNEVGLFRVDADARVVAVDGEGVYYRDGDGAHSLQPEGLSTLRVTPAELLDVRSRIRAFQVSPESILVVQSYFNVEFELPGQGAALSPDGNIVATRLGGPEGEVALYDTRSGDRLPSGLAADDHVLAFAPGDQLTVSYIVEPAGSTPGGELVLRTCDIMITSCQAAARIADSGGAQVLAR